MVLASGAGAYTDVCAELKAQLRGRQLAMSHVTARTQGIRPREAGTRLAVSGGASGVGATQSPAAGEMRP